MATNVPKDFSRKVPRPRQPAQRSLVKRGKGKKFIDQAYKQPFKER